VIWAILVGNTRTVAGLMLKEKVTKRLAVPTDTLRKKGEALSWARRVRRTALADGIIVASVVPPVDAVIRNSIQQVFNRSPEFVRVGRKWGITVKVKKPFQVGADRLANAVAAKELYGAPVIVVDYGTGTTFDVVDQSGAYCGGAILPGIGTSLKALRAFTAKIPLVSFKRVSYAIGRTTEEAVRSGIYHGAIGTTRELLFRIRKQLGFVAPAIATGGWCKFFKDLQIFNHINPDLTLVGLSILWRERNAEHRGNRRGRRGKNTRI